MTKEEEEAIRRDLLQLRQEHRDLDAAIEAIDANPAGSTRFASSA